MSRLLTFTLVLSLLASAVPTEVQAEAALTRRDALLTLWSAIRRTTEAKASASFADVPPGSDGYDVITFANQRGLLDDTLPSEERFAPDAPVTWGDGLLWLVRTRNVADPEDLTPATLTGVLLRYQQSLPVLTSSPSAEAFVAAMRAFDEALAAEVHEVSNYGEELQGETTAFGEIFDWRQMTAAHRTLPYNTLLRVTNVANDKSVIVRINDRGPYVEGRNLDLSAGSFMVIADGATGILDARFERLGDALLVGDCYAEPREKQRIAPGTVLGHGVPDILRLGTDLRLDSRHWFQVVSLTFPDGNVRWVHDWVGPREGFSFTPSVTGTYVVRLQSASGRGRDMPMRVVDCGGS
jgi:rare lipoprotein A